MPQALVVWVWISTVSGLESGKLGRIFVFWAIRNVGNLN